MKFERDFTLKINKDNKTKKFLINSLEMLKEKDKFSIFGRKDNKTTIEIIDFDTKEEAENWIRTITNAILQVGVSNFILTIEL